MFNKLAPAVRRETKRVALLTIIMTVIMWAAFGVFHLLIPDQVPFDYRVILGGIGGAAVAIANFFLMALTMQAAASVSDEKTAQAAVKMSYTRRMALLLVWTVIAIVVPVFQFVAGIAPIFFPSLGIKFLALTGRINLDTPSEDTSSEEEEK